MDAHHHDDDDYDAGRSFGLFTASIGSLIPSPWSLAGCGNTPIQTAQDLRDHHAIRRLQKLPNHPQRSSFHTFILRGTYNFFGSDVWYQPLQLSAVVASAIVQVFQSSSSSFSWKCLEIWKSTWNEHFVKVLNSVKCQFTSWVLKMTGCEEKILKQCGANNPQMTHLLIEDTLLDLALARQLKEGSLNTKHTEYKNQPQSASTRLKKLELINVEIQEGEQEEVVSILEEGFRNNDSLVQLSLVKWTGFGVPASLIESWDYRQNRDSKLQELDLSGNRFVQSSLEALARLVMNGDGTPLKFLSLNKCEYLTESRNICPFRIEEFAKAMDEQSSMGVSSLTCLSLRDNWGSSRELQNLLTVIYQRCPRLETLDFSQNRVERIIWKRKVEQHKQHPLKCLWLARNPILHNRFRSRAINDNRALEELLLDFPSLGQLIPPPEANNRGMPFSDKVHLKLVHNYIVRGTCVSNLTDSRLWFPLMQRIPFAVSHTKKLFASQYDRQVHKERLQQTCQATVLFLLLRSKPSQVTLSACGVIPLAAENAALAIDKNQDSTSKHVTLQRTKSRIKKRQKLD